ncbi:MAG: hypothetical protein ABIR94_23345 [Rubrivivax sp.]
MDAAARALAYIDRVLFQQGSDMQAHPWSEISPTAPRVSSLWLLVPVTVIAAAAAAAWWPHSPEPIEVPPAPLPVVAAQVASPGDGSVPQASSVHFTDDAVDGPVATF